MMKEMLPEPWKRLVELMQSLNFGRITGLAVRAGQPDLAKGFRTVRTVKLPAGENGPRPEVRSANFDLRKEVMAMQDQMAAAADGAHLTIEVKHGLPFIVEIEQEHRA